ncbi:phospholipase D family protein [Nitrosopumilus sp.]|uniref:phospholipase D family protein n=1 Tax=Nitrosopumilus sp. TaxID=2024843 RepID=UPI003D104AC0
MDEYRHKRTKIIEEKFTLTRGSTDNTLGLHRQEFLNAGKKDHKIKGKFYVNQNEKSNYTIKFFILTDQQFVYWAGDPSRLHAPVFTRFSKQNPTDPQHFLYSSKNAIQKDEFELNLNKENILYFIFDNSFSTLTSKDVELKVWEEWEEKIQPIDVVTTIPPEDRSLSNDVKRLISLAKKELKIISPYLDTYMVKEILEKADEGVEIQILTREKEKFTGSPAKQAFDFIRKKIGKNHRTNEYLHSRLVICDQKEALVSSADIKLDSMTSLYNAGIVISNPDALQKLLVFFKQAWKDSEEKTI